MENYFSFATLGPASGWNQGKIDRGKFEKPEVYLDKRFGKLLGFSLCNGVSRPSILSMFFKR